MADLLDTPVTSLPGSKTQPIKNEQTPVQKKNKLELQTFYKYLNLVATSMSNFDMKTNLTPTIFLPLLYKIISGASNLNIDGNTKKLLGTLAVNMQRLPSVKGVTKEDIDKYATTGELEFLNEVSDNRR